MRINPFFFFFWKTDTSSRFCILSEVALLFTDCSSDTDIYDQLVEILWFFSVSLTSFYVFFTLDHP